MPKYEYTKEARHGIPAGVKLTDMMRQYVDAKSRYPEAILFFRMGDFYEMFFEDAELGGLHLGLTVTSRNKDSAVPEPMSGFPHHQLNTYLNRALEAGFKVSVCEQLSDPKLSKGIVERGITQIVTPGVVLEGDSLQERSNHYLVAVYPQNLSATSLEDLEGAELYGIAALDVPSGVFTTTEAMGIGALRCELSRLDARELLLPVEADLVAEEIKRRFPALTISRCPLSAYDERQAERLLQRLITDEGAPSLITIREFGFGMSALSVKAAGAAVAYVIETQRSFPESVRCLTPYFMQDSLILDETASQNLELFRTLIGRKKRGSLLGLLDRATSSMGARRIKRWLTYPLINPSSINARLDIVEALYHSPTLRADLRATLKKVFDLERLNTRASLGKAGPKELAQIRDTLNQLPDLKGLIGDVPALASLQQRLKLFPELCDLLGRGLIDDPPALQRDGGFIREGFNDDLDELVNLSTAGKEWIINLEQTEREKTGITSLKVRHNRVFGYYIEISKANLHHVPEHYIRRQTLANSERYYTTELKEFEDKVVNADTRRIDLELDIFNVIREMVQRSASELSAVSEVIADLDAFCALAEVAHLNGYCRPVVHDQDCLDIREGRHPVVEASVGRERFIPNDIRLDEEHRLLMITGPNMSGKSTVMRQVALIAVMAQMGSFVPATSAEIGVVDRIFTRVGAADDLASGRSTFMVEMSETATILRESTAQSLVILDEIGRGTSTYDGVSIAWSVAEYLHDHLRAKSLFATHYHELTEMAEMRAGVHNYTVAVTHEGDDIIFLHQLVEGGASKSYGIQVAQLAGLPVAVTERAKLVLQRLEEQGGERPSPTGRSSKVVSPRGEQEARQLSLFSPPPIPAVSSEVERMLKSADLNQMTPMQALNFLHSLSEKVRR